MTSSPLIRPATGGDLPAVWAIRYADDIAGEVDPPPLGPPPPYLSHVLATGDLLVAEIDGRVVGFAGLVRRGTTAFLTDLFVAPIQQSSSVGKRLLNQILPTDGSSSLTVSSTDPRALALYVRSGLQPWWPNISLEAATDRIGEIATGDVDITEEQDDRSLSEWDQMVSGRFRRQDLRHLLQREAGTGLWLRRQGEIVGFGIVRTGGDCLSRPGVVTVGPIGVSEGKHAALCTLAAVAWARTRGATINIAVPGPHPALAALLNARFRITYVETYCATDEGLIDPTRYIGSGGDLF